MSAAQDRPEGTVSLGSPNRQQVREALGAAAKAIETVEDQMDLGPGSSPDAFAQAAVLAFLRAVGLTDLAATAQEAGRDLL